MGRKSKISPKIKLKAVDDYLTGKLSIKKISIQLSVDASTVRSWIRKFKVSGEEGLITANKNNYYSAELKHTAITDYLNGHGSLSDLCIKYNISSIGVLSCWINKYNSSHKILKSHNKGDKIMTNGRRTTYEERIEIISFCIANYNDYRLAATKYNVSYQQVYTWVRKYNSGGAEALVDRRGKKKDFEDLNESEKFAIQLKLLEAENRRLKMENDFLKKLEEIERR